MFPHLDGDLFYSYSTCGTDASSWISFNTQAAVAGQTLRVAVPTLDYPLHFKRDAEGNIVTGIGPLYRDDSVPWEGSMINYLSDMVGTSRQKTLLWEPSLPFFCSSPM